MKAPHSVLQSNFAERLWDSVCAMELPVLELDELVPFPGITVNIGVTGAAGSEMLARALGRSDLRFVAVLTGGRLTSRLPAYGTEMEILGVETDLAGSSTVTAYGRERHRLGSVRSETVTRPDGNRLRLQLAERNPAPLPCPDPNTEQLAAWDAANTFRRYCRRLYSPARRIELSRSLPDSPFLLSAYMSANANLKPSQKFRLLAARTLAERLRLLQQMLLRELRKSGLPAEGSGLAS